MYGVTSTFSSKFKVGQPVWFKRHGSAANEPGTITEVRGWVMAVQIDGGQEILVDQIFLEARIQEARTPKAREAKTSDAKK